MDTEYKPNSHKSREDNKEKTVEKRVSGKVVGESAKTKKKSGVAKAVNSFVAEDLKNVKSYVTSEVLIPKIKDIVFEAVKGGIGMILFGESFKRGQSSGAPKISYGSYYSSGSSVRQERPTTYAKPMDGFDFDEVVFATKGDAESVLAVMDETIERYGIVSVSDFYELAGVTSNNFAINRYGWSNIRSAEILRVRDGYIIKFPKVGPLN